VAAERAEQAAAVAPTLQVSPRRAPKQGGGEAMLTFAQGRVPPGVVEVQVGGEKADIVEVKPDSLRVRIPPGRPGPSRGVEVRRQGWQQYVLRAEGAFEYYEAIGFGASGQNVELLAVGSSAGSSTSSSTAVPAAAAAVASAAASSCGSLPPPAAPSPPPLLSVASRATGLVQALALTATPVPVLPTTTHEALSSGGGSRRVLQQRYFEVELLEWIKEKTTKAFAIGFAWPPSGSQQQQQQPGALVRRSSSMSSTPDRGGGGEASASSTSRLGSPSWGRLPETAGQLRQAFVAGGDLPKVYLDGQELGKVQGWRPLLDLSQGAVVGALLEEHEGGDLRLTIVQNGVRRWTSAPARRPASWTTSGGEPHGVVDICGNARQVQLRQGAAPPALLPAPEAAVP